MSDAVVWQYVGRVEINLKILTSETESWDWNKNLVGIMKKKTPQVTSCKCVRNWFIWCIIPFLLIVYSLTYSYIRYSESILAKNHSLHSTAQTFEFKDINSGYVRHIRYVWHICSICNNYKLKTKNLKNKPRWSVYKHSQRHCQRMVPTLISWAQLLKTPEPRVHAEWTSWEILHKMFWTFMQNRQTEMRR